MRHHDGMGDDHGPSERPTRLEVLVSVDVETSGPTPGTGSLLAIGACLVDDPSQTFYRELQPIPGLPWDEDAARIHGLDRVRLEQQGAGPAVAMAELAAWLEAVRGSGTPVMVSFNAPFDWMFVADYLWRYLGRNPFGHAALDLKALYMGRDGVSRWAATTKRDVVARYPVSEAHTHQALDDALMQAAVCRRLLHDPR
jgi:DNA polymerase III epsilon subunit-like protein